jgi:hypothetical protein
MKTYYIYKARTIGDQVLEDVTIIMDASIQERFDRSATLEPIFQQDATDLADALWQTLPGGTFDALLRKLLERRASQLAVPMAFAA